MNVVRSVRHDPWMRRWFLLGVMAGISVFGTATVGASASSGRISGSASGSHSNTPTWSAQWLQANPGQPLVLILNPRGAKVCFVALRSSQASPPVAWRFSPGGHRLRLTLLTHADAAAGTWVVSASCQRAGVKARTTKVTISVPSPGGSGVLAAHGDMRVQIL